MIFPNKLRWNMIFLVLSRSRKMIFLFAQKCDLTPRRKMKGDISQKKYTEIQYYLQMFWRDGLLKKRPRWGMTFVVLFEKVVFFSRQRSIFPWAENKREMIFFKKYTETCFLSDTFHAPLPKKFNYDLIPQKRN